MSSLAFGALYGETLRGVSGAVRAAPLPRDGHPDVDQIDGHARLVRESTRDDLVARLLDIRPSIRT